MIKPYLANGNRSDSSKIHIPTIVDTYGSRVDHPSSNPAFYYVLLRCTELEEVSCVTANLSGIIVDVGYKISLFVDLIGLNLRLWFPHLNFIKYLYFPVRENSFDAYLASDYCNPSKVRVVLKSSLLSLAGR